MKIKYCLLGLFLAPVLLLAQSENESFFDPERDPVGRLDSMGRWTLLVDPSCLERSLKAGVSGLGAVHEVSREMLRGAAHLVFYCKALEFPEQSVFIAVALREAVGGNCYVEDRFETCRGEPCSDCRFSSNGCFCAEPAGPDPTVLGVCNHSTSRGAALKKVKLGYGTE